MLLPAAMGSYKHIYIYIYTTKYIYAESVSDMVLVYHIALGAGVGNEGAGVIR